MSWYDENVPAIAVRYEVLEPQESHAWMADLLPGKPSFVVNVGTRRDAAWLPAARHEVTAAEPFQRRAPRDHALMT